MRNIVEYLKCNKLRRYFDKIKIKYFTVTQLLFGEILTHTLLDTFYIK